LAEALREARANLTHLIETIRAERPEFMPMGLDLPKMMALIPKDGALVAPLITSQGSVVYVLTSRTTTLTEAQVIAVDEFTDATLQMLLQGTPESAELGGWLGAYRNFLNASDATPRLLHEQAWHETIEVTGKELWDGLLGRVHSHLNNLKLPEGAPVVLMPQGGLGLLPLHAAWHEVNGVKRAFLDDYTVSFAPSGYALRISQQRLQDSQRQHRRLLAVINPTADLDFTSMEGQTVVRLFDPDARQELVESEATRDAVIKSVLGKSHLHFSCHGFYSWQDPMQSGLLLADRVPLTLADTIGHLDLSSSRLVTLSACETGLTDIHQAPDEYLGLPTGFLQAGSPSVVSTLWAVNDLSTMLLMERFYHHHLEDKLTPSGALRQAQRWLRDDATAGELRTRFTKERDALFDAGKPTGLVEDQVHRFASMDPSSCPFASPFYWAAFTVNGA
jgi:CHAT domain-containing protein